MNFYDVHSIPDVQALIQGGLEMKKSNFRSKIGKDKTMALVFLNPSLRTRMSTQEAAQRLGMQVIVFNSTDAWPWELEEGAVMDMNSSEHIKDAARVISSYVDIIGIRCFAGLKDQVSDTADKVVKKFIQYSSVPVVNLESAALHPLQSLADMMTMEEVHPGQKLNVVLTWAPHPKALPQAVGNSFAQWSQAVGHHLTVCHPPGFDLDKKFTGDAKIIHNQEEAYANADIIYAKSWCHCKNYGAPSLSFRDWIIDQQKMAFSNNAYFMHCLPVRRNVVVTDEVIDGDRSLTIQQAHNRMFAAQVVLDHMIKNL